MKLNGIDEAVAAVKRGVKVYEARYDGVVWAAGHNEEVGDTLGFFTTKDEAEEACRDYEATDFDRDRLSTSVEELDRETAENW